MRAIQMLAVGEPRLTARLARLPAEVAAVVVFDLEDALWDVVDASRTPDLKAEGRRRLLALLDEHPDLAEARPIGVRLNRLGSPEAELDVEALAATPRGVTFEVLVLAKVESGDDLGAWTERLARAGIRYRRVMPIIETRVGLANVAGILAQARRSGVEQVVYGHYDFCLDAGWWPFPELDDAATWAIVEPFIEAVEAAGLAYVSAPYFRVANLAGLGGLVEGIRRRCRHEPGILTLNRSQTIRVTEAGRVPSNGTAVERARPGAAPVGTAEPADPTELARQVVATFLADRRPGLSFVIEPLTGRFISPHVFLAARAALGEGDHG